MNLIIGLCGPSGSGKTTLAKILAEKYASNTINLDSYFLLDPPYKKYDDNRKNWELPENVDWAAINGVVNQIHSANQTIKIRKIDWRSNSYTETELKTTPITVIEGFLLLHSDELIQKLDLTVYIDVPDSVGLQRRMDREGTTKNQKWFEEVTFPEYAPRREEFRQKADLILNGEDTLESNAKVLMREIDRLRQ